jgi:putative PIN family toxin of toxin-antitoxin system
MELLQMAASGEIDIAVSQPIINETVRVLRDKFGFSSAKLEEARTMIEACTTMITPTKTLSIISEDEPDNSEDEPDNRILECAVESGSDTIVSGDNDLLRHGNYQRIRIVKPGDFLNRVRRRS